RCSCPPSGRGYARPRSRFWSAEGWGATLAAWRPGCRRTAHQCWKRRCAPTFRNDLQASEGDSAFDCPCCCWLLRQRHRALHHHLGLHRICDGALLVREMVQLLELFGRRALVAAEGDLG